MKTFNQLIQERDMMGWFSIPKMVRDKLESLGYSQKSVQRNVKYIIEDDWGDMYVKVENKNSIPSKEIEQYANTNSNVMLDKDYPVNGFTLIIRI